ncbi:unnamed protein product [Angiostrongylus costaricensis]|uniref:Golgi to ER traffic protein 4-like protein n=1 Tax=Angiostrongylus costaricensis TaxID=334426 RepID=A0A0R3PBK5_ANGCS|nr:unnamed protein product [Angiostrongylus costaricensis]
MQKPSLLEKKALDCLCKAEYYEAHQIYRTLYFRMILKEQFIDLLDLLYSGSKKLADVKEVLSAIDLAELYAETLLKAKCEASEKIYGQIFSIIEQFCNPSLPMPASNAQNKFISTCVMWSQAIANKRRERKHGLSELHYVIAQAYSAHQQYANARNHMLFADHPEEFAKLLHKMRENGGSKSSECEMFCVLPCLQAKLFEHLVQIYKHHLDVDPKFHNYLSQIGHIFFGIQSSKNKGDSFGGLLGNILKGVLGEKKDEELYFSDSDFESGAADKIRLETEEAYETAEESDGGDMRNSKEQVKQNAVENFDDLD